jgi:hypothetical protein
MGINIAFYFFICVQLVLFYDFLQSDWLRKRAALFTIFNPRAGEFFCLQSFYKVAFKF